MILYSGKIKKGEKKVCHVCVWCTGFLMKWLLCKLYAAEMLLAVPLKQ